MYTKIKDQYIHSYTLQFNSLYCCRFILWDLSKLMPEESLTNLKLLSNVVADYNYDYYYMTDDGLKFLFVTISYWSVYKEWMYMWKRNVVIKKATRELFVVLSDEIKRKSAQKPTICHSSQLDTPFFCYTIYISLIQGSKFFSFFFYFVLIFFSLLDLDILIWDRHL